MNKFCELANDVVKTILLKDAQNYEKYLDDKTIYQKYDYYPITGIDNILLEITRITKSSYIWFDIENTSLYNEIEDSSTIVVSVALNFVMGGLGHFDVYITFNKISQKIQNARIIATDNFPILNKNGNGYHILQNEYKTLFSLYDNAFIVDIESDICINTKNLYQYCYNHLFDSTIKSLVEEDKESYRKILDFDKYTTIIDGVKRIDKNKLPENNKIEFFYRPNVAGKKIIIMTTVLFIYDSAMDKYLILLLSKDISEPVHKYNEFSSSMNRELNSNICMLSHDLKGAVNNILGYSTLVEMTISNKDQALGYMSNIKRSVEYISRLIHSILDKTELSTGKVKIQRDIFKLNNLIDSVIADASLQAKSKNINIINTKENIMFDTIYTDDLKLKQILTNLVSNAIKFTGDKGSVVINTTQEKIDDNYFSLILSVKDSGRGISNNFLTQLFKPFTQEVKDPYGTGLGLSITHNLVTLLQGEITVESEVNVGTTFTVRIPLINTIKKVTINA